MRLTLLILLSVCYGTIIHVPADYPTIQEGIDAAAEDDIVVVSPNTYQENIVIDKTITLTSLALFNTETETIIDSLDTWFEWGTTQYDITNDSILATIIDGSQPAFDSLGSTILIKAADDDCISPKILGFTITGGKGTLIDRAIVDPETGELTGEHTPQHLGGGLFSYVTTPDIRYNYFYNNGSMDIEEGGAVYAVSDPDDCPFPTRSRCEIDEIDFSHNFFRDNTSRLGKILANRFFDDEIKLSNCVIDCYCETTGNPNIYWVKVDEPEEVDYEETTSDQCPFDWDVWVSPIGSDDGEGSEAEPFQTINWALAMVVGTEDNPVTINLTEGTFSPSTSGESFSINMVSNVNLIGQGEEVTILDADSTGRVIIMEYCDNNIISDLTITGGLDEGIHPDDSGGGMYLHYSNPILTNVTIANNTAGYDGGGMYLSESNPTLDNVTISNNTAGYNGGGMYLYQSYPTLTHVTIENNTAAFHGGGMNLWHSNPILTYVTISGNTAQHWGGGMYLQESHPILTHVTISGNTTVYGGGMNLYHSNPILTHVTISGNNTSGEFGNGGGMFLTSSNPTLTNSIIWANNPESIQFDIIFDPNTITINYSDIQGGEGGIITNNNGEIYWLEGNIDSDPLFTDPDNGDYTLMDGSPCIDAGTAYLDGDGYEDITDYYGLAPDMGAYEYCESGIYDECGVCDGDNSPNTGICDCEGTPNGYAVEDCAGVCDGYAVEDCDGVCNGDNLTCTQLSITNVNTTLETLDIYLINTEEIGGFQFDLTGITITGSEGGDIVPSDWWLTSGESTVIGFSLQGTVIPAGSGTLVSLTFANFESEICLENVVLSDLDGSWSHDFVLGECYNPEDFIGCTDETACNYNSEATQDDGSCEFPEVNYDCDGNCIAEIDCNDECGGTAEEDECGVCAGDNSTCTGCTDETACNYDDCNGDEVFDDPCIIEDNELCSYPEEGFDCDGNELSIEITEIPDNYSIANIYPNPFNPLTTITYGMPESADVQIEVYNISGKLINTLIEGFNTAGYHTINWNASSYPSGVYLIRMESGSFTQTQKVVLVK